MSIHDDARKGTLTGATLIRYLKNNPKILNEQDPSTGWASLATGAVAGHPDVVDQLLKWGAKADALSRKGETALLLTTRETKTNRARIVQLLLTKLPAGSIDATTKADGNTTPLMYSVRNKDLEAIGLLVKAGASLKATNDKGENAAALAGTDKAVLLALDPKKKKFAFERYSDMVNAFLLYIVSWVNKAANGIMNRLFGLNPSLDEKLDKQVNKNNQGGVPDKAEFLKNVDQVVKNSPLERFFKGNPTYIQDLAKKATELEKDPSTPLGQPDLLPKVIKVTLHQQVIYCDDSSSMKREGRWEAQVELVRKIARITSLILPSGDGVALRFINQEVPTSENLTVENIRRILENVSWLYNGDTPIGTNLKFKILQPLVYDKLKAPATLKRPLLISVITDGMPSEEKDETFVEAIKECGTKLQAAGYPRDSVKFLVGQVGTGKTAAAFLRRVADNSEIKDVVYVTSDQLDERLSSFKDNERELDRWLIETLFKPIKEYK